MSNIQDRNFNKNVAMVYVEEHGFTGFKGFDFTKIDDIESILQQGVVISGSLADSAYISGIKINTDSIKSSAESLDNKIFATGETWPQGVQGTVVFQADLNQQFDGVTSFPEQSSLINNFSPSGLNSLLLTSNPYRRELYIQNLATGILYVKYGVGASDTSFNFVLSQNTSTNAGDGGSLSDQGYNGDVSVSGVNGVNSPRYIFWERSSPKSPLI